MDDRVDDGGSDGLSLRRRQFSSARSISMATVQAQVTLAQSLRNLFQAARGDDPKSVDAGHVEDKWLQAVYNAVVFAMVGVFVCILIAVYLILEPFLHPILWAVLTGAFLFPFKHASTYHIERWLEKLDVDGIPLIAGVFLSPVYTLNHIVVKVEQVILGYWKLITFLVIATLLSYIGSHFDVISVMSECFSTVFHSFHRMDLMLSYTKDIQVLVVVIGVPLLLWYVNYSQQHQPSLVLQSIVVALWYLVLVNVATLFCGAIGVPLVTLLFAIAGLGYVIQSKRSRKKSESEDKGIKPTYNRRQSVFGDAYDMFNESILKRGLEMLDHETITDIQGVESEVEEQGHSVIVTAPSDDESDSHEPISRKPTVHFESQSHESSYTHEKPNKSVLKQSSSFGTWSSPPMHIDLTDDVKQDEPVYSGQSNDNISNQLFLVLFTLCTLLVLLRHPWLLLLTAPLCLVWCIKQLASLPLASYSYQLMMSNVSKVKSWCYRRQAVLFPQPIPTLLQLCGDLDRLAFWLLKQTAGSFVSALIIISLLLGSVGFFLFIVFQIQLEITHSVGLATQVLNTSQADNQWIQSFLGNGESIHVQLEQFADKGFYYGREWLANYVQGIVTDTTVQEQILKLYDKMYHIYVFQNSTDRVNITGSIADPHSAMKNLHIWSQIKHFLSENLETILSILKSLWSLLTINVTIGITLTTSFISVIFSGGTLLLNFVVFITTLFYLLCYSEDKYLPIEWILSALPSFVTESNGSNYAEVFTRVIQSVFHASLRRACFYGLYTWLVLSIFGIEIIILPSVLAALAGAVPFVGPYWVGLGAVLKLWLVEDSVFLALVALILFLLPPFTVETLINSGIEGSHPYMTGLAIAGGIYFAGLEGAMFGPILLCCLLFVVKLLTERL